MRRLATLTLITTFCALCSAGAQEVGDPQAGAIYARQYCARCHAIADENASPKKTAPRFKDVANTPGKTATALRAWLKGTHPTMPNIILEPNDMSNVVRAGPGNLHRTISGVSA